MGRLELRLVLRGALQLRRVRDYARGGGRFVGQRIVQIPDENHFAQGVDQDVGVASISYHKKKKRLGHSVASA